MELSVYIHSGPNHQSFNRLKFIGLLVRLLWRIKRVGLIYDSREQNWTIAGGWIVRVRPVEMWRSRLFLAFGRSTVCMYDSTTAEKPTVPWWRLRERDCTVVCTVLYDNNHSSLRINICPYCENNLYRYMLKAAESSRAAIVSVPHVRMWMLIRVWDRVMSYHTYVVVEISIPTGISPMKDAQGKCKARWTKMGVSMRRIV